MNNKISTGTFVWCLDISLRGFHLRADFIRVFGGLQRAFRPRSALLHTNQPVAKWIDIIFQLISLAIPTSSASSLRSVQLVSTLYCIFR